MSDYQRFTAAPLRDVLALATEVLTARGGLTQTAETPHGLTFSGPEGVVQLQAHRHGFRTDVVVRTNQLRTSKVDGVVRFLLTQLPFQPGDPAR